MENTSNSFTHEVSNKFKQYRVKDIFTYTGVSKLRILLQLLKYSVLKGLGKNRVEAAVNSYRMKLDLSTPGLSKVLYVYGTRELPDTYLVGQLLTEGMVVADVGANIGYYTLLEAQQVGPTGHVHAFEPDPRNLPLLKENVTLNGMDERVTVIPKAVSNKRETKQFLLGERSNVSSFVERPDVVGATDVECIPLPEYEAIEQIDFLRMDAEGYECEIVEGLIPYLSRTKRPFTVMLEVHPFEYNDNDRNFTSILERLFALNFNATYVIAGTHEKDLYEAAGYSSVGHWQETKHARELYENVKSADVIRFIKENKMRALVLSRS